MTSYEEFVETTRRYYVHPEEIARYKDSFGLSAMKEALGDDTQKEQGIFLRMRSKNSEYRYKSVRFSYYSEKREYIIVTSQDVEQSKKNEMMVEDANRKILAAALRDEKETLENAAEFLYDAGKRNDGSATGIKQSRPGYLKKIRQRRQRPVVR